MFSSPLRPSLSPVRAGPQHLRWKRSAAGCSLIVWLTAGQLFIFLFISGALNRHMLGCSWHRQVDENGERWMDRCVNCDTCFTSKISILGVVGFDKSGLQGLIRQAHVYTVDTHNDEYLWPRLHKETFQFLIQKCVYSVVVSVLNQSCVFVYLHHRRASAGQRDSNSNPIKLCQLLRVLCKPFQHFRHLLLSKSQTKPRSYKAK